MAVAKLEQASHNELNDLRQKHWDLDIKLGEILNTASMEVKMAVVSRLPGLIDEIKAEMAARESDI